MFTWTTGSGVASYSLYMGSTRGAHDLAFVNASNTSTTVNSLPAIGTTIYVRLCSLINGAWQYVDYAYVSNP